MAKDPAQNVAFDRFLRSIGVTSNGGLLTKGYDLMEGAGEQGIYYRAEHKYVGHDVTFIPKGFYEKTNAEGSPVFHKYDYNMHIASDVKELAASKTIGGAILGAWSMRNSIQQQTTSDDAAPVRRVFLYKLTGKSPTDISHWHSFDFPWLQEVRFRRPVKGEYLGVYNYTTDDFDLFNKFYEAVSMEDGDTVPDDEEEWEEMKNAVTNMDSYLRSKTI